MLWVELWGLIWWWVQCTSPQTSKWKFATYASASSCSDVALFMRQTVFHWLYLNPLIYAAYEEFVEWLVVSKTVRVYLVPSPKVLVHQIHFLLQLPDPWLFQNFSWCQISWWLTYAGDDGVKEDIRYLYINNWVL